MIFYRHPNNTSLLKQSLLDRMANTDLRAGRDRTPSQMLIKAAHIYYAGHTRIIDEHHFATRRDKDNFFDGMIELLGNGQGLHITDPASSTGMDRVTDLILALQNQSSHPTAGSSFSRSQARWSTTNN